MPYSVAPWEPPLANSVPSPAGHQQFYKVNCGFVGPVCIILSSYCACFYQYCDLNMSSGFWRSLVGSGLRMDDSLHEQNDISGLVCLPHLQWYVVTLLHTSVPLCWCNTSLLYLNCLALPFCSFFLLLFFIVYESLLKKIDLQKKNQKSLDHFEHTFHFLKHFVLS